MSLLMIDIDRFKSINDTFGHLAGDEAFEFTGVVDRPPVPKGDILARYGGEEFCLMLPDTALADALRAAERVRGVVAEGAFVTEHARVSVTVSNCAACVQPPIETTAVELIEQADKETVHSQ